jgi:general nucleoside transport system ATP-binding protein
LDNQAPAVEMRGIVKRFPGVLANDHADLTVGAGEIHALLGENGAGKSTLMNILAGLYRPDEGQVFIHGKPVEFRSPRDAIATGIGMVHQHFMLVESQTVAENVILGLDEPRFVLDMKRVAHKISEMAERYSMAVDPDARIWQLSVGEQQRVEILKALYHGADILILDEPTAVLTPQEAVQLYQTVGRLAAEGKAIIFISHKLSEVFSAAHRVTVLRGGKVIGTTTPQQTTEADLACMMVGREVLFQTERSMCEPGAAVLSVEKLHALGDKGLPALRDVNLTICSGEIVGVAGVAGNGQRELAEVITGLRKARGGTVRLHGKDVTNSTPRQIIDGGVSHVPEDRLGMGLVGNLSISDNTIMKGYRRRPLARGGFLNRPAITSFVRDLIAQFQISAPNAGVPVRLLSGGNLQKVILAREITAGNEVSGNGSKKKPFMVAVHPTRGLDVGATESVRKLLVEQRDSGAAILLISEDLDELLAVSDRVAVMHGGEIMGIVAADNADIAEIGLMMAGKKVQL